MRSEPKWFRGVVTEDAEHLLLHAPARYEAHYRQFAGQEVRCAVIPFAGDYTAEMLGYYRGHVVEVLREAMGEVTNEDAHHALVQRVHCLPWDLDIPSTGRAQWDRAQLQDHITRSIAFLTEDLGLRVEESEPDPVRRLETQRRRLRRVS